MTWFVSSKFVRENWSILSRYQSFTKKLAIKLNSTFFRKNWPNFEHYARVIFIHDLGRELATFCAFYMITFGLKVARYCPLFEHMFFSKSMPWAKCGLHVYFYGLVYLNSFCEFLYIFMNINNSLSNIRIFKPSNGTKLWGKNVRFCILCIFCSSCKYILKEVI